VGQASIVEEEASVYARVGHARGARAGRRLSSIELSIELPEVVCDAIELTNEPNEQGTNGLVDGPRLISDDQRRTEREARPKNKKTKKNKKNTQNAEKTRIEGGHIEGEHIEGEGAGAADASARAAPLDPQDVFSLASFGGGGVGDSGGGVGDGRALAVSPLADGSMRRMHNPTRNGREHGEHRKHREHPFKMMRGARRLSGSSHKPDGPSASLGKASARK
jgi:hypothetical protein